MIDKGKIWTRYREIQEELAEIFHYKIDQYGPSRYEKHSDQFNYWMCFSDVHRKTLRLEQLTITALSDIEQGSVAHGYDVKIAKEKLISDYKDIANYAIMAVQILEERDDAIRTDSNK